MTGTCFRCAASGAGTTRVGTLRPREGGDFPVWCCDACLPAAPDPDHCFFVPAASRTEASRPAMSRALHLTESAPFTALDLDAGAAPAAMTAALPAVRRNLRLSGLSW
ncbi:hypothetical protein [Streptomyces sp. H39-S7]|uniref:hypothetical protein n=1 Tax=Streptomyces sp. H39-S7 TaxID=3004357 RepID=UPI0022AFA1BA|nr:hypothetical protein [Streptomyces sp. H39-S7]MCZ4118317.1 hypothetical protein [Streptomyces sp. H39-S7]